MFRIIIAVISIFLLTFLLSPFLGYVGSMKSTVAYWGGASGMLDFYSLSAIFTSMYVSFILSIYHFFR